MIKWTGLPHSEIHGSKLVCSSPWLFAAYHVLHRLLVPRHPPYALSNLTKNSRRNLVTRKNTTFYLVVKDLICPAYAGLNFILIVRCTDRLLSKVETTGIEPATYSLQSYRSPN